MRNKKREERREESVVRFPNLSFWALFIALNLFLFIPFYWAYRLESTFWPSFQGEVGDGSLRWLLIKYGVIRQNADLFRLVIEWILLIAAWVWIRPVRPIWRRLLVSVYLFGFVYNCYDTLVFAIYNEYPNLYDDTLLLISGIEGLTRHIGIPLYVYVLIAAGILFFFSLCRRMIMALTHPARLNKLNRLSHLMLLLLVLYSGVMVWQYAPFLDHPRIVASSITAKVRRNLVQSVSTYNNRQLLLETRGSLQEVYDYSAFELDEKPDIFIIFVESYGDALYQFDDLRHPYLEKLTELEASYAEMGWRAASIRSDAPIQGGKSWLSYTSFLFGLRVSDEAQYDVLLEAFQHWTYPDLGNYLSSQGYDYHRITPLLVELERDRVAWEETRRFFGYDQWLFLNDMDAFAGRSYGWGPSPPDQYTLSFLRAYVEENRPVSPHLYFYITHNSHLPWTEPPQIADDWRSLSNVPPQPPPAYDPYHETKEAYLQSIIYQLEMVQQLVADGPDDTIYVIVGDHQPPLRAFADYSGSATPLHIIAKDNALLAAFEEYGFQPGLQIGDGQMRHEGFYSLFMRVLLSNYGSEPVDSLPPFLPDGIDLNALATQSD